MIVQKFILASMKSKQKYYILNILYTNSEISIGLQYIHSHFHWWLRLHHCATLVHNLSSSIFILTAISLLKLHALRILVIMDLFISRVADSRAFPFPRCRLTRLDRSCPTIWKILCSSLKKAFVSIKNKHCQIHYLAFSLVATINFLKLHCYLVCTRTSQ